MKKYLILFAMFLVMPAYAMCPVQQIREFAPAESDYSYNSSCQFGVCMQNRSTPLFQQPKQ